MNILIFAAGLGTRLKPLTDTMPKALVPVQGTPLLGHLIHKIKNSMSSQASDIHIVINIHHFADQIIDYVRSNQSFGLDIQFSDERYQLLETGGGLRKALPLFPDDSPILIHNVDILSNVNLSQFYASFPADAAAQMIVSQRNTSRYLLFGQNQRLLGWTNVTTGEVKGPSSLITQVPPLQRGGQERSSSSPSEGRSGGVFHYAFSGIQIVNPTLLRPYLDQWQGKFSIIDFYLSICDKVDIRCDLRTDLHMIDVGKLDTLDHLRQCNIQELL